MPPLSVPKPLDKADCPLLVKHGGDEATSLIAAFNAAVGEVQKAAADRVLGPWLLSERARDLLAPLAAVRDELTRGRYVVGFIGLTQAGKSTAVNNVLGEEVCKQGSGDACSSQPSRIVYADRRGLDVEYLSTGRLETRRGDLCQAIGISPGTDADVLALLDQPEKFRRADGPSPPRLKEDIAYLRDFLHSRQKHAEYVRDTPRVDADLPYEKRYSFTTHTPGAVTTSNLLVREAKFKIDNPKLPPDLELCDLPGLDSKRTADDLVTWEYLPELHGTFLFVNVGMNLLAAGMLGVLDRLRDKLAGRTWVIFTKMDSLSTAHFRPGADNIFAPIKTFLERVGIAESQVVLASNKIWDAALKGGGVADPAFAALTMSQTADAPVPATCPDGLKGAWAELLKDGGISSIRGLMFRDVAVALAGNIRRDAGKRLADFDRAFAARVKAERDRETMNPSALLAAMTCHGVVLQLRTDLAVRPAEFPILNQEAARLRQALTAMFEATGRPDILNNLSPDEFPAQFKTHARMLDHLLRTEAGGDMLEKVYQVVGQKLDAAPPVAVGGHESCQDAWRQYGLEDRADDGWRTGLPVFGSGELMGWLGRPGGDGVDGDVYVGLMREKIDVAVRQTVHVIRSRLRTRLGEIAGHLSLITGGKEAPVAP